MIESNKEKSIKLGTYMALKSQELLMNNNLTKTKLSDIVSITSGSRPKNISKIRCSLNNIPVIGASKIIGFTKSYNHNEKILTIGRVGTIGVLQSFNIPVWVSDNALIIHSKYLLFVSELLRTFDFSIIRRGSTQPLITQGDLNNMYFKIPSCEMLMSYEKIASDYNDLQYSIGCEVQSLNTLKLNMLKKYFD